MAESWIVLGALSPVARAFARTVAQRGAVVILAGRDREELERAAADLRIRTGCQAEVLDLDVTRFDRHGAFIAECRARIRGTLNLFVAVGAMPEQEAMDRDPDLVRRTIDTVYTGVVALLHGFAPHFERQGSGRIVVLGSVAGDRGRLKNYVYGSAKAGLHAYLQGLRARLFRAGVTVTTVKPGFLDTGMTFGMPGLFLVAAPEDAARACWRAAAAGKEEIYFPRFWRAIMAAIRMVPERLFKRLRI